MCVCVCVCVCVCACALVLDVVKSRSFFFAALGVVLSCGALLIKLAIRNFRLNVFFKFSFTTSFVRMVSFYPGQHICWVCRAPKDI